MNTATIVQEGTSAGTSSDYTADGTIVTLQTHTKGSGLPIVLMGDGFIDTEITDGTYAEVMEKAVENLFTEEPIKSLKEYFDIYYVTAVSRNNVFGTRYSTVFSCSLEGGGSTLIEGDDTMVQKYVNKIANIDMSQALAVVILNTNEYAGTTYFGYPTSSGNMTNFAIAYCPIINGLDDELFREVLVHEAVGHGFAKLADEYSYEGYGTIPTATQTKIQSSQTTYGWFQNVDFTTDKSSVLWSAFLSDDNYTSENLGTYEGAYGYTQGIYRPSESSMMNANDCAFNAPSRKEIYDRVMEDGAGTTPTYDEFVTFDMATYYSSSSSSASLKSATTRSSSTSTSSKRFHEPQFATKELTVNP